MRPRCQQEAFDLEHRVRVEGIIGHHGRFERFHRTEEALNGVEELPEGLRGLVFVQRGRRTLRRTHKSHRVTRTATYPAPTTIPTSDSSAITTRARRSGVNSSGR